MAKSIRKPVLDMDVENVREIPRTGDAEAFERLPVRDSEDRLEAARPERDPVITRKKYGKMLLKPIPGFQQYYALLQDQESMEEDGWVVVIDSKTGLPKMSKGRQGSVHVAMKIPQKIYDARMKANVKEVARKTHALSKGPMEGSGFYTAKGDTFDPQNRQIIH